MNSRERFFATINREPVDRPATWLGLPTPDAIPGLLEYFKAESIEEIKTRFDDDVWPIEVPYNNPPHNDIGCALDFTPDAHTGSQDERVLTHAGFFENKIDPAEVDNFNWPIPGEHMDLEESKRKVQAIPEDKLRLGIMWSAHFQDACSAFGMENAYITMMMYPEMFKAVIDRIVDFHLANNKLFYEATKGYLDAVLIGNDFGSQISLLVDPDMLRQLVLPGTQRLVEQAKSYGLTVVHHSCGSIVPIIGDLYDLGVDVVHPIQALAKGMDAESLKSNYAERGIFCGGVDAQELLVNGSPEDIKKEVKRLVGLFPTGLVISPSHEAILPDIAPANVEAMFEAVKETKNNS